MPIQPLNNSQYTFRWIPDRTWPWGHGLGLDLDHAWARMDLWRHWVGHVKVGLKSHVIMIIYFPIYLGSARDRLDHAHPTIKHFPIYVEIDAKPDLAWLKIACSLDNVFPKILGWT